MCGLLPRLRALLKLPHDSNLLSALQEAVERLQNSHRPDKDVSLKLEAACTEMENIAMNGVGPEFCDAEDIARYQEEQHIEMSAVSEPRRLVTGNTQHFKVNCFPLISFRDFYFQTFSLLLQ